MWFQRFYSTIDFDELKFISVIIFSFLSKWKKIQEEAEEVSKQMIFQIQPTKPNTPFCINQKEERWKEKKKLNVKIEKFFDSVVTLRSILILESRHSLLSIFQLFAVTVE